MGDAMATAGQLDGFSQTLMEISESVAYLSREVSSPKHRKSDDITEIEQKQSKHAILLLSQPKHIQATWVVISDHSTDSDEKSLLDNYMLHDQVATNGEEWEETIDLFIQEESAKIV